MYRWLEYPKVLISRLVDICLLLIIIMHCILALDLIIDCMRGDKEADTDHLV